MTETMAPRIDPDNLTLLDPAIQNCPFHAYAHLRDEAPVFFDRKANLWVITRHEDFRAIARDAATFSSQGVTQRRRANVVGERQARLDRLYAEKGWPRTFPLGNLDPPQHTEMRALFDQAFAAGKIGAYEDTIRTITADLADAFVGDGACEVVSQFAIQIPLRVLCAMIGAPTEAVPIIRETAEATASLLNLMLPEDEEIACVEKEIAAQHYFKALIDRLRAHPDGTVLSDFVNIHLPSGRQLSDAEILMHLMFDLFLAGGESAAHAITNGVLLLAQDPDLFRRVQAERGKTLRAFIEETLRLQPPLRSLSRVVQEDVTLHGVTIPKGSLVMLRIGAANRDPRQFECPADVKLDRPNLLSHVTFGSGIHTCAGQSVARREMHWAFTALLDRIDNLRVAEGQSLDRRPSLFFRALPALEITFTPRADAPTA